MLYELRSIEEHSEKFNKLENTRKYQTDDTKLKNMKYELKSTLEGINNRLDDREEWISNLEERIVEIIQSR